MTTVALNETAQPAVQSGQKRVGVLLVNLGTPDTADAPGVRVYLKEFLSDARVIEERIGDNAAIRVDQRGGGNARIDDDRAVNAGRALVNVHAGEVRRVGELVVDRLIRHAGCQPAAGIQRCDGDYQTHTVGGRLHGNLIIGTHHAHQHGADGRLQLAAHDAAGIIGGVDVDVIILRVGEQPPERC